MCDRTRSACWRLAVVSHEKACQDTTRPDTGTVTLAMTVLAFLAVTRAQVTDRTTGVGGRSW
jgi:hypothetical protein